MARLHPLPHVSTLKILPLRDATGGSLGRPEAFFYLNAHLRRLICEDARFPDLWLMLSAATGQFDKLNYLALRNAIQSPVCSMSRKI